MSPFPACLLPVDYGSQAGHGQWNHGLQLMMLARAGRGEAGPPFFSFRPCVRPVLCRQTAAAPSVGSLGRGYYLRLVLTHGPTSIICACTETSIHIHTTRYL